MPVSSLTALPAEYTLCPPTNGYSRGNYAYSTGFKSQHNGGAQFAFADGSTHMISATIDYETYQRMGDRRDGQPLDWTE